MSSTYNYIEGHCWPIDYITLIDDCLQVDSSNRIDIVALITKLKKLSGPPINLSFIIKEKKIEIDTLPLPPPSPSKIDKVKIKKTSNEKFQVKNDIPIITADFANFENLKISTNDNDNNNDDNDRISFGNFISSDSNNNNNNNNNKSSNNKSSSNNNNNNDDDDDEFGDFASSVNFTTIDNDNVKKEVIKKEVKIESMTHDDTINILKSIIHDNNIIKQGNTYIMRPHGIFKKILKKTVWIVLSSTGLMIKKANNINKIHYIFRYHYYYHHYHYYNFHYYYYYYYYY
jgi:hypothetical protein